MNKSTMPPAALWLLAVSPLVAGCSSAATVGAALLGYAGVQWTGGHFTGEWWGGVLPTVVAATTAIYIFPSSFVPVRVFTWLPVLGLTAGSLLVAGVQASLPLYLEWPFYRWAISGMLLGIFLGSASAGLLRFTPEQLERLCMRDFVSFNVGNGFGYMLSAHPTLSLPLAGAVVGACKSYLLTLFDPVGMTIWLGSTWGFAVLGALCGALGGLIGSFAVSSVTTSTPAPAPAAGLQ
jgi:hypothetical protein